MINNKNYLKLVYLFLIFMISSPLFAFNSLNKEDIIAVFKNKLPLSEIIIYDEETDTNNLLGRPGQYIGKANWADSRIEQYGDSLKGGTIEIFDSEEALENRKNYLEPILEIPLFAQYMYVHKNVILRLDKELTPDQAEEYKKVLESL